MEERILSNNDIITIIKENYSNKYNHTIMLNGEWGCGKTYFIKNTLSDELKKEKINIIHISLYGISTLEQLEKNIKQNLLLYALNHCGDKDNFEKNLKKIFLHEKNNFEYLAILKDFPYIESTIDILISFLKNTQDQITDHTINNINSKYILVLDDFERCSINIKEVLGYINNLSENQNQNIIIIANETKLQDSEVYKEYKEKSLMKTIEYIPDFEQIIPNIIREELPFVKISDNNTNSNEINDKKAEFLNSFSKELEQCMKKNNYNNIRTIQQVLFFINRICDSMNYQNFNNETNNKVLIDISLDTLERYISFYNNTSFEENNYQLPQIITQQIKNYISYSKYNKSEIRNAFDECIKQYNNVPLSQLRMFYKYEDSVINKSLKKLYDDMKSYVNEDNLSTFFVDILFCIYKLNSINFSFLIEINNKNYENYNDIMDLFVDRYINIIKYNTKRMIDIHPSSGYFDKSDEIYSNSINKINSILKDIYKTNYYNTLNNYFNEKNWAEKIHEFVYKEDDSELNGIISSSNHKYYLLNNIDVDKCINCITKSDNEQIYILTILIRDIYLSNSYFESKIIMNTQTQNNELTHNINNFIYKLRELAKKQTKIKDSIKSHNIENLIIYLNKILNIIKNHTKTTT